MAEQLYYPVKRIGTIQTPYERNAPYQPINEELEQEGAFCLCLDERYRAGLFHLEKFRYLYVLYYLNRQQGRGSLLVKPPWAEGKEVGVFASRSPARPTPIGLSVVQLKKIVGNQVYTSPLDVFNGTPLLDIKPYIKDLDVKKDANVGWIEEMEEDEHLLLHIKGIPHDY